MRIPQQKLSCSSVLFCAVCVSATLAGQSLALAQQSVAAPSSSKPTVVDEDDIRAPVWINDLPVEAHDLSSGHRVSPAASPVETVTSRPWLEGLGFSSGGYGVLRLLTADTGVQGQLRLQLGGEVSSGHDVIIRGDQNTRLGGALSGSYSPIVGLEVFGALLGSSNKNRRICSGDFCQSEAGRRDPEVIRSFGDLVLGGKFGHQASLEWSFAAYGQVKLYSATDGVFFDFGATSVSIGGVATWDLSLVQQLPFRLHVNGGGLLDNSSNLQNFSGVPQPSELAASFGYGLGRSRLQTLVAVETTPWHLTSLALLSSFVEYQLDWVTGSANSNFESFTSPGCNKTSGSRCQENRDQHRLALGVRGRFNNAWSVTGALDFGLRSFGFPYGSPSAPFTLVFQLSRAFDLGDTDRATKPGPNVPVAPEEEEPDDGLVTGRVLSAADKSPIANAIVGLVGRARSRVATDADGSFTSHDIAPGIVNLEVTAPGYEPQVVRAQISAGLATDVEILLLPRLESVVRGQVVDINGKGLVGRLQFNGSSSTSVSTDAQGRYETALVPGFYVLRAEVSGHLTKEQRFSVEPNGKADLNFVLRSRKEVASASYVAGRGLVTLLPLAFDLDGDGLPTKLNAATLQMLDEVVDVLVARPRITKLSIEAHWDNGRVGNQAPQKVTELQIKAIGDYLLAQGIAADRLSLVAKGSSQPLSPNVGLGRMKNRRVLLSATEEN
jgi:hypothetical protein